MTTITINERTKAGKTFLEFAQTLPFVKVNTIVGLNKPVATKELTPKQRTLINRLKKVKKNADAGMYKTQSLKSFYDGL